MPELHELLTTTETKTLLRVHEQTIYNYIKRGYLHPVKVGARLRFHRSEIEAYLAGGTQDAA
jgi:excisionase family DNA binding protein